MRIDTLINHLYLSIVALPKNMENKLNYVKHLNIIVALVK